MQALVTADRHSFFKCMVRSIAERHGLRATFLPKPFADLTGNGCHTHVSLWTDGRNLFDDPAGEVGVSALGYQFLAGMLHSADALAVGAGEHARRLTLRYRSSHLRQE